VKYSQGRFLGDGRPKALKGQRSCPKAMHAPHVLKVALGLTPAAKASPNDLYSTQGASVGRSTPLAPKGHSFVIQNTHLLHLLTPSITNPHPLSLILSRELFSVDNE